MCCHTSTIASSCYWAILRVLKSADNVPLSDCPGFPLLFPITSSYIDCQQRHFFLGATSRKLVQMASLLAVLAADPRQPLAGWWQTIRGLGQLHNSSVMRREARTDGAIVKEASGLPSLLSHALLAGPCWPGHPGRALLAGPS